ncbi:hypothetical protein Tsubulata_027122 [Turnera subulata]|uniref:BHLH domain-containing protein n=1 Tax=Turnera subulata TaxID=218843 RepID=A0A9Q0GL16_9ROSI|nr:hypothetical protein Tsubulata_027122 [Turnera subulata]
MPLSELLYRLAKGKMESSLEKNPTCSADLSFVPQNDFGELVWENGQVQSTRTRKVQTGNSLHSHALRTGEKDASNGFGTRMGKFGTMDPVLNEAPLSVPSVEMGTSHDDDMVPWLSPIESLQHDYCSEFLPELSGPSVNEHSSQSNFGSSFDKRSGENLSVRPSNAVSVHNGFGLEQENVPRVSLANDAVATRPRTSAGDLYASSSVQCQTSFSFSRSRASASNGDSLSNSAYRAVSGDSIAASTSGGGFPSNKMQKPGLTAANPNLINFSHFHRPATLVKANLQNIELRAGSGVSGIERVQNKDKGSVASSTNPSEPRLVDPCINLEKKTGSPFHPTMIPSKVDSKPVEGKPLVLSAPGELPEAVGQEDGHKTDANSHQNMGENAITGWADVEKATEPVVASSSVCSGNSVERASDDLAPTLKRKHRDTEESEGPSDDVEEESVGVKKPAPPRAGSSSKRSRAAEVHNLSERRRRDRINEKMRALQELIPNCNKVDKASMLDEAIEYLKTLQLQVQIMSMGAGLYMPSMMLPPGMSHMHAGHMAQFLPMGAGMGMGMGYGMGMPDMNGGSSGCSMYQMPPMHGTHFSGPPMPGPGPLPGMGGSNLKMFGLSGQGLPMPFARPSMMPIPGGPLFKTNMELNATGVVGPSDNLNSAAASSSKDASSQVIQNSGAASSMNQTANQVMTDS